MIDRQEIKSWIARHTPDLLNDIMSLIQIRSISGAGEGQYPYGKGCAAVLDKALEIGAAKGFDTENHAYRGGSIILRGATDREIGIFAHLDVVPEGIDWKTDPYIPCIRDGWLFGRGSADNKGPAMAALYSMFFLLGQGRQLNHTVRLFLGCNEEKRMDDISFFLAHNNPPDFSLVPDSAFPICYAEDGIIEAELSIPLKGNIIDFSAGTASNSVPAHASIWLKGISGDTIETYFAGKSDFSIAKKGKLTNIKASGRSAHAAFPEGSENAAGKIAKALVHSPLVDKDAKDMLLFVAEALSDYYGETFGLACSDNVSGKLTVIGGMTSVKDGRLVQNVNIRYPVSVNYEDLAGRIYNGGRRYGWTVDWIDHNPPYYIDPERKIVTKLNAICCKVWQKKMVPYSSRGGTYARKLSNAVGYGPSIPGQAKPCPQGHGGGHQPDECVKIDNLVKAMEIYILALLELDCSLPLTDS